MRSLCRVGARWPTGPYICSRRSTSLTGLPTSRAAMMPRICGPEIRPLEPKPPPRNGLRIWIFSGANAEQSGDASLRHREALARRVDGQRVAVPCRHDRVRLHRVVILRRRLVGRVDARRRRREARLDVAALHCGRIADADGGRHEALAGIETDPGRRAS